MKIGIIGEGLTEYESIPKLVGKFNHTIVVRSHLHGVGEDYPWEPLFNERVYRLVRAYAQKDPASKPDKVIVIIDRERRSECCGDLAATACGILQQKLAAESLAMPVAVIIPNQYVECWLLAQPELLDNSPIFKRPISGQIGAQTDEKNILGIIDANLKPGRKWESVEYGKMLAQKIDLRSTAVLSRSRSLKKLVKEIS